MKNLINSKKLISINYMFSTNNTMHKFVIEYSCIATAMGTMLRSTDNNVKSMELNETVGIAIYYNKDCILGIIFLAMTVIGAGAAIISGIGIFWFLWGMATIYGTEALILSQCNW